MDVHLHELYKILLAENCWYVANFIFHLNFIFCCQAAHVFPLMSSETVAAEFVQPVSHPSLPVENKARPSLGPEAESAAMMTRARAQDVNVVYPHDAKQDTHSPSDTQVYLSVFLARDVIYTSLAYVTMSASVCL